MRPLARWTARPPADLQCPPHRPRCCIPRAHARQPPPQIALPVHSVTARRPETPSATNIQESASEITRAQGAARYLARLPGQPASPPHLRCPRISCTHASMRIVTWLPGKHGTCGLVWNSGIYCTVCIFPHADLNFDASRGCLRFWVRDSNTVDLNPINGRLLGEVSTFLVP